MVELGDALVLAAQGGVGTLGGLLLDDVFHLLTELALLGADDVLYHTAVGDSGHCEREKEVVTRGKRGEREEGV